MKYLPTLTFAASLLILLFSTQTSFSNQDNQVNVSAIALHQVGDGFSQPLGIASTGVADDSRLFILEKGGKIKIIERGVIRPEPFLNLEGKVSLEAERGLLGMAFDPAYTRNGYFYVNYSDNRPETYGDTVIARYKISADPNIALAGSEEIILEIAQETSNHNGGHLAFDSTGQLVIGMGDGGGTGDPLNRAQDKRELLGKMLRINVHGDGIDPVNGCGRVRNYKIPADNPRPNGEDDWCPEILSSGWRNPWRYSLDPENGRMWVGDVGQDFHEEISLVPKTTTVLRDYGWSCFEGIVKFKSDCGITSNALYTKPIITYNRVGPAPEFEFLGASVTGGLVYDGDTFPELQRHYFYGDFISGKIWAANKDADNEVTEVLSSDVKIASFGQGNNKEAYLVDHISGELFQIIGNYAAEVKQFVPTLATPQQQIVWRFEIKNIGVKPLTDLVFTNQLPQGVVWISGGNVVTNEVEVKIAELKPGETKVFEWEGLVPISEGVVINKGLSLEAVEGISFIDLDEASGVTTVSESLIKISLPMVGN
ncbi:MAG: sorbosone dehydrogenase family protein [Anaerolineae bacterium]